jgi:hypothetical protein
VGISQLFKGTPKAVPDTSEIMQFQNSIMKDSHIELQNSIMKDSHIDVERLWILSGL